jgi:phosphate transport system permease protein
MQKTTGHNAATSTSPASAVRLKRSKSMFRQSRPFEAFIQSLLFFCGVASIFTTIGIILTLGSQASVFFSQPGEIHSNRTLAADISAEETQITLSEGGSRFDVGYTIEIGHEEMLVTEIIDASTVTVQRGYDGTQAETHTAGLPVPRTRRVTLSEFLTGTTWQPQIGQFGILPLLNATLLIAFIAMLVALPVGLGTAVYLSEYASPRVRSTLKPILEILAGVPTVVFGYFALTFVTPMLRSILGPNTVSVYNMASAGIVIGILIVPIISTISEDALRAVPRSLREASYGLGATKFETTVKVLLPAALSGILAAVLLGISRAVGETMVVAIASGAGPNLTLNPFEAAETITGHIARISTGDLSFQSMDYNSLFALGLALFLITLLMNIASQYVTRRFREVYQ